MPIRLVLDDPKIKTVFQFEDGDGEIQYVVDNPSTGQTLTTLDEEIPRGVDLEQWLYGRGGYFRLKILKHNGAFTDAAKAMFNLDNELCAECGHELSDAEHQAMRTHRSGSAMCFSCHTFWK